MNQETEQTQRGTRIRYPVLIAAIASILAFLVWRGYERHTAIEYIEERGGRVSAEPLRPAVLDEAVVATFGNNLTDITDVSFQDTGVSDAAVDNLVSLTRPEFAMVERVNLENTNITDASLQHLTGLTKLKRLILENTNVSDSGLTHVTKLTSLQGLILEETNITDAGLPHLRPLKQLQELSLAKTRITDDGLPHLWAHTQLTGLDLRHTDVTEAGVADLQLRLPDCRVLHSPMKP